MKIKHSAGEININKAVLSAYSNDQLKEWAEDNGISAEDLPGVLSKVKGSDAEAEPKKEEKAVAKPKNNP